MYNRRHFAAPKTMDNFRGTLKDMAKFALEQPVGTNDCFSYRPFIAKLNEHVAAVYQDGITICAPSGYERTGEHDGCMWLRMPDDTTDKYHFFRHPVNGEVIVRDC